MKVIRYNLSWYTGESRGTIETTNRLERDRLVSALTQAMGFPPHCVEVAVNVPLGDAAMGPELPFGTPFPVGSTVARKTIKERPERVLSRQ